MPLVTRRGPSTSLRMTLLELPLHFSANSAISVVSIVCLDQEHDYEQEQEY